MRAPEDFAKHLTANRYHPRSNAHSNALGHLIIRDLVENCPRIAQHASKGQLVYDINYKIQAGTTEWNIDYVLGQPAEVAGPPPGGEVIRRARPSYLRIAIEAKAVMTEHGKAQRNRQRDIDAFHQHVHASDNDTIAAGIVVLNIADTFCSPLRNKQTECPKCGHQFQPLLVTTHEQPKTLVKTGVTLFRGLPGRSRPEDIGLEAMCVVVVDYSNRQKAVARVQTKSPAPEVGDPLHYDHFIQVICQRYTSRWP